MRRNSLVCTSPGRAVILIEVSVALKLTAATGEDPARSECARKQGASEFMHEQVPCEGRAARPPPPDAVD